MFRSSIMKSDWWKCGIYASSQLWGVHMFDDVSNILGTSYSTWWMKYLSQIAAKFVPICWKMTRNKTNLLCTWAYKNRPKRKETSIQVHNRRWKLGLWLWPRNKATVIPMEESSSCLPRGLRQMKSGFKSMLCVLERWGNSSGVFFFSASLWINSSA